MREKTKRLMEIKPSPKSIGATALIALGALFIFSGVGKIIVPPEMEYIWVAGFLGEGITGALWKALPFIEILLGALFILRFKIKVVAWVVLALVLNFVVNNFWLIIEGYWSCGECLGWGIDIWPIASIYIDLIMIALLLVGCKYYLMFNKGVSSHGVV